MKYEQTKLTINQDIFEILDEIVASKSEILAFSCYIWNTDIIKKILPMIHNLLPQKMIILGGPNVSYNAEKWIEEFSFVSYVISGQGESSLQFLIDNNFDCSEKIVKTSSYQFDDIVFPYLEEDFPEIAKHYIYYESSRGCLFSCSYCLSSRSDQVMEFRNTEKSILELGFFIRHKTKIVKFVDRTFNANKSHSQKIWDYIIKQNTETTFHFEVHPIFFDETDFAILDKAPKGRIQFEVGIQSLCKKTQNEINRKNNWEKTKSNIKKLIDLENIHVHLDLIAGLPFETLDMFKQSFNEVMRLKPEYLQLGFLKILPGTEMQSKTDLYENIVESFPPYQIIQNKWLPYDDMKTLRQFEVVFQNSYNSEKFANTFSFICEHLDSFTFFQQLSDVYRENTSSYNKQWVFYAKLILIVINEYYEMYFLKVLDLLRLDWIYISKSSVYPDILINDIDKEISTIKKMIRNKFIENKFIPKEISSSVFSRSILYKSINNNNVFGGELLILIRNSEGNLILVFNSDLEIIKKIEL